jgi:superfamily II DNA or RNA helicase/HKD family nuclease
VSNNLPAGLYDMLLTARDLERINEAESQTRQLTHAEGARLIEVLQRQLAGALNDLADGESVRSQLSLVNGLLGELRRRLPTESAEAIELVADPAQLLTSIRRHGVHSEPPEAGLTAPWLFTAGKGTPSLLSELRKELAAADQVDILVSFITVSGMRRLRDVLEKVTATGADSKPPIRIRVLTTTYIGATEIEAVDELANLPGCNVRISLDGRRTRLHAKAWIFHRDTGFGSAYVGSANLTGAALAGGLEWTVKFTQRREGELYARAIANFDTLWEDPEFQSYDPNNASHRHALTRALGKEAGSSGPTPLASFFELEPKTYQKDMLEQLATERSHGRFRNLVIAATGTGKTVVAAFDYRRTCELEGHRPRLLFVAHRREILEQAHRTYREVLRDGTFGQLLSGQHEPDSFDHVFATIDSINSRQLIEQLGGSHWHTVVIDECHRIAGDRFSALATGVKPRILLGLTATPERTDGQPISVYFDQRPDGSPAVELRLWDALELQLLSPFEYYACDDETDFSTVPWNRVGEQQAIAGLISNNDIRARTVLREWRRLTTDPRTCRALVFCVSIDHAKFMTDYFQRAGLSAVMVYGETPAAERDAAIRGLASGAYCALVTVDLFNEGVDIPSTDTILMLRPTQSALLFQQQLGRGLRLYTGKDSCLVLDFVGHHNASFRYDRLLSTITGKSKRELIHEVEHGFSSLPAGCHIQLQKQVRDRILGALKQQIGNQWRSLRSELQALASLQGGQPTLGHFLREQGVSLEDVYRESGRRGWTLLKRDAGLLVAEPGPEEEYLSERFANLRHRDAPNQIEALRLSADLADSGKQGMSAAEAKLVQMLAYQVDGTRDRTGGPQAFLDRLRANPEITAELRELAGVLESRSVLPDIPLPGMEQTLLTLHGSYEQREILTAVDFLTTDKRPLFNTGVLRLPDRKTELMFVTLDKSSGFHEGISYHDYAISPKLFHWQSQNAAGPDTPAGKRYLESDTNGWAFQLFVRVDQDNPFIACGPVRLLEAQGGKPMNITWELGHPLTARLFQKFSVLRGQ